METKTNPLALAGLDIETFKRIHAEAHKETEVKRIALIASKGTLDMAYPPLILASTAAALGMECSIFFTFYGMDIINKKKLSRLKVAPLANPAMPMPVPNLLGAIPGMTAMATFMMKRMMKKSRMPSIPDMLQMCRQMGVKLIACTTTMGVMGVAREDLVEGAELEGAASFLSFASKAQVTLFI